ncbi:PHA/PHB synthase family protein [Chitinimonas lacunae]|uniref:PHA/PHB synthase family protein n=1 Tax=Chitinimonas lacunae TaxID=1963018 RepID=A0ABV8MSK7_9NEIS
MSPSLTRIQSDWMHQQETRYAKLKHQLRQSVDPWGLGAIWQKAALAWLTHPHQLAFAWGRYGLDLVALQAHGAGRWLGLPDRDVFPSNPEDQRFAEPVWRDHPGWDYLKESYLMHTRWIQDMLYRSPGLSEREQRKSAFWLRHALNFCAPTNFLPLNPVAQQKAWDSGGETLVRGLHNLAADMARGEVTMTDRAPFQVGVNLALTPGSVVYRNHLLEVIHYAPTTPKVHATPLVLITPWINKYYILDLTPQKSLVRYLVEQGFDVYITSWKNPGADQADLRFDDYIVDGADKIVEVARSISKAQQVHALGYCIGGTLLALYMAWLKRRDPQRNPVAHWTLLTTLVDFEAPGDIEVFIDEDGLDYIDRIMERQGYLGGHEMASSFRMLRANSLIWHYVVNNYLYGETPPALDVLYWNTDMTRMPRAMHRYYLREFYLNNRMVVPDSLHMAGQAIDLRLIDQELFMVGAEEDHITPWRQTCRIADYVSSRVLYTLSTSGHIVGVVNPPTPTSKRSYWQGEIRRGDDTDAWQAAQSKQPGSWWPSWVAWLRERCGPLQTPPTQGNRLYKKLAAAPGSYVLENMELVATT